MDVYSEDGKIEEIIKNSVEEQLTIVEQKSKEKGIEFVGVKDSDTHFFDENLLVKINGKLYELNPHGVSYARNNKDFSVKNMLLNTI